MFRIPFILVIGLLASNPSHSNPQPKISEQFQVNHIALRVDDLATSISWWQAHFGAKEIRRSSIANINPDIEIALLRINNGFHIELVGGGQPKTAFSTVSIAEDYTTQGYKHVGFMVENLDATLRHFASLGTHSDYKITREDYGVEIVLIKTPSDHFVEIYSPIQQQN